MSKLSSSVSNLEEEENDFVDLDNAPTFGGGADRRDFTMKPKRKGRGSLTASTDLLSKKKRDSGSSNGGRGGGDKLHESGSKYKISLVIHPYYPIHYSQFTTIKFIKFFTIIPDP